ncbi:MAG: chorismate-binding protein [Actinomycetes bacterium]
MKSGQTAVVFGDRFATDLVRITRDPNDMDSGWWAVLQTFEGEFFGFQFANNYEAQADSIESESIVSSDIRFDNWMSNVDEVEYQQGVETVRESIAAGWVYQINYCRILTQKLSSQFDSFAAYRKLRSGNPAPYACAFSIPRAASGLGFDIRIASASPELFLERNGKILKSSPIKGTAISADAMLDKDSAENIMIVDLIRNDLSHVCLPGTVAVPDMLRVEKHPGLVHLVSDVVGELREDISWAEILQAMCPPGSVSGAPKSSSLQLINQIEPQAREVYCGVLGWIDVDNSSAQLSVAIRTFWQSFNAVEPTLCFGTGAGITYDSDPLGEWNETQLKAQHLLSVISTSLQ